MDKKGESCGCMCHKVTGVFVGLIGVDFLLGAFDVLSQKTVGIVWPILLILIGLKNSVGKGKCNCCEHA